MLVHVELTQKSGYSVTVRCGHCGLDHATVNEVKDCSARHGAASRPGPLSHPPTEDLDQIRMHGLAPAGLSGAPRDKRSAARSLRRNQTPTELALGAALSQAAGPTKFDAQVVVLGYIADFYCSSARLVIEVDGDVHAGKETADRLRDDVLRANWIGVVRVSANRVTNDLGRVVAEILRELEKRDGASSQAPVRRPSRISPSLTASPPMAPAFQCSSCGLRRSSVSTENGLCHACMVRPSRPQATAAQQSKARSNKRPFVCLTCRRRFFGEMAGREVACYRCRDAAELRPICRVCDKAVESVNDQTWWCARCADAREVALRAAGSGETPIGPLSERPARARRWRRN